MGAILLNGAVIEENCLIAAGALVTQNTVVPAGSLVIGSPAVVRRSLREEETFTCNLPHRNMYTLPPNSLTGPQR